MRIHVGGIGLAVVTLAAIGCSENSQQLPPGPRMSTAASTTSPFVCDFKSASNLATHYFGSAEAKTVRGLISLMQSSPAFGGTADSLGFEVMAHIAANIKAGNSDVADASNLTNALLVCMYDASSVPGKAALPASYSETPQRLEDFTVAANPTLQGGYDVRGGPNDLTDPVLSRPFSAPLSGVAPCASGTCTIGDSTWRGILSSSSNPAPKRVLVYGAPGGPLLPNTYDWRVVPRNTTFSPPAIVGVCLSAQGNPTSLLHEENVGLLPFADAGFLRIICSQFAAQSWSAQFASRVARWGMDLFGPRPLSATTFMNPGGLAGSTGGIHSDFGPVVVNTVTLTFTAQPSDVTVDSIIKPAVVVRASAITPFGTDSVPNVEITISSVNNNGTPAILNGTLTDTTDASGTATFANLSETKTGGYVLVATGTVNGRTTIFVTAATSARFNVKP